MKMMIKILLLAAVVVGALYMLAPPSAEAHSYTPYCVELTWHHNMICEWPFGHFTNYTAGNGQVVLAGDIIPENNSWDKMSFQLSGYLINNGSCTIMVVNKATSCYPSASNK